MLFFFFMLLGKNNRKSCSSRLFVSIPHLSWCLYLFACILLELKVISLCHQYRARPACTSVQSDQALYCSILLPDQLKVLILISLKMILTVLKMDDGKFSRLQFKNTCQFSTFRSIPLAANIISNDHRIACLLHTK